MGQLPLPEHIPRPKEEQIPQLEEIGIHVIPSESNFWEYSTPEGWQIIDYSTSDYDDHYYIVDTGFNKWVRITGTGLEILDGSEKWEKTFAFDILRYNTVVRCVEKCGMRYLKESDDAYEKLKIAYDALSEDDRKVYTLPDKVIIDTGFGF